MVKPGVRPGGAEEVLVLPAMMRSRVLLPAPLLPMTPILAPG